MKSKPHPSLKLGLTLLIVLGLVLIVLGIFGLPNRHQRFGELVSGPTLLFVAYITYDIFVRRRSRRHLPPSRQSASRPPSQIKGRMPIKSAQLGGPKEEPRSAFLKQTETKTAPTKTEFMKLASARPAAEKPAAPKPSQAP